VIAPIKARETPLRIFLGVIIGILLTIGTAYVVDSFRPSSSTDELATRPMVNWDVVDHNLHGVSARVQEGWTRLTGRGGATEDK
jgi:predicted membrane protein